MGTGNITGVAIALTLGGPGAIFWMWVVALIGMATAFTEATLAQVFKTRAPNGESFVGGPAYYIQRGLGSLGEWSAVVLTVLIFTFAFTSLIGNYAHVEVNVDYLGGGRAALIGTRVLVLASIATGALVALDLVWQFADLAMGLMSLVNLVAITLLGGFAFATLRDWERQKSAGANEPHFVADSAGLPRPLEGDVWAGAETPVPSAVRSRRSGEPEAEVVGAVE